LGSKDLKTSLAAVTVEDKINYSRMKLLINQGLIHLGIFFFQNTSNWVLGLFNKILIFVAR
jgi:hypothetical protein